MKINSFKLEKKLFNWLFNDCLFLFYCKLNFIELEVNFNSYFKFYFL